MLSLCEIIIIGVSLSLDAFYLSLIYGTFNIKKVKIIILSVVVGIYHFIMPLIGHTMGITILKYISININYLLSIILIIIGINMIIEFIKDEKIEEINISIVGIFLFGLTVSIDSFSIGIGLSHNNGNLLINSIVFSIISSVFTYFGLILGKKLNQRIGRYTLLVGGIVLIAFSIFSLTK